MILSPPPGQPAFIEGRSGALFTLYRPAHADRNRGHCVIFVPPFAEEMNKARRSFTLLSDRLTAAGVGTVVFDPHGTGDSAGDFSDARWDTWRDDLARIVDKTRHDASRITLLGLRLGALLALDYLNVCNPQGIENTILWQPPASGEQLTTQFLRLLLAASLTQENKVTTKQLRERLAAGEPLEIAGYTLHPELIARIDTLKLDTLLQQTRTPVDWFEIVSNADKPLPPASQKIIDSARTAGSKLQTHLIVGEPFWSIQEITVVPDLIEATATRAVL